MLKLNISFSEWSQLYKFVQNELLHDFVQKEKTKKILSIKLKWNEIIHDSHSVITDFYRNANINDEIPRKSRVLLCKRLDRTTLKAHTFRVIWNM